MARLGKRRRFEDLDEAAESVVPVKPRRPPGYEIWHVAVAVFVFYAILATFGARGLHRWTTKLPVTAWSTKVHDATNVWWGRAAGIGLETPGLKAEKLWLQFQDASPLLYPKPYDLAQQRRQREVRKEVATRRGKTGPVATKKAPNGGPSLLLLGDSIMAGIGPVIRTEISARIGGAADLVAKVATGLARPDVFDWRSELRRAVESGHYDYIVMMLGTNDSQDFVENGEILAYGTQEWVRAYNARVADMMTAACRGADKAFWIGLPPMKSETFNRKAIRINSWAQRQAAAHPCVKFVSLDHVVGDEKGTFTSYLKVENSLEKVRNVDGIHITKEGGLLVSQALIDLISRR